MATKTRAKQSAYPVVLTFQTTLTQEARLQHARATRAVNMSQFIRDAIDRALNDLEGRKQRNGDATQEHEPLTRRRLVPAYGGSR